MAEISLDRSDAEGTMQKCSGLGCTFARIMMQNCNRLWRVHGCMFACTFACTCLRCIGFLQVLKALPRSSFANVHGGHAKMMSKCITFDAHCAGVVGLYFT